MTFAMFKYPCRLLSPVLIQACEWEMAFFYKREVVCILPTLDSVSPTVVVLTS